MWLFNEERSLMKVSDQRSVINTIKRRQKNWFDLVLKGTIFVKH